MHISVVIPCYNSEKYISKTIESILLQTVCPLEIILVYDKGEDNTLNIIKEKEEQSKNIVKVIELEENKGISYARNYGVKKASGDYILFMDSDDIAEPTLIEKYIKRLGELSKDTVDRYALCYSAYVQIDQNDNEISGICRGIQCEPEEILGHEIVRNHIMSTSGVLVKKESFIKLGGFNESIIYSEDWDLWLRLAAISGFAYVEEPLVKIRRHGENMSSKVDTMLDAEKKILKQYDIEYIKSAIFKRKLGTEQNTVDFASLLFRIDKWEEGFFELKELLDKGYNFYNLYFYIGLYYLKNENFKSALEYFKKTIDVKNDHGAALNNIGAILLLDGDRNRAEEYFDLAIRYFPSYMDANMNYKLLNRKTFLLDELKFTWRELRKVLTSYSG